MGGNAKEIHPIIGEHCRTFARCLAMFGDVRHFCIATASRAVMWLGHYWSNKLHPPSINISIQEAYLKQWKAEDNAPLIHVALPPSHTHILWIHLKRFNQFPIYRSCILGKITSLSLTGNIFRCAANICIYTGRGTKHLGLMILVKCRCWQWVTVRSKSLETVVTSCTTLAYP